MVDDKYLNYWPFLGGVRVGVCGSTWIFIYKYYVYDSFFVVVLVLWVLDIG